MAELPIEFYELTKVIIEPMKPGEFRISTAAVMSCGLCSRTISGMGGPGDGAICTECGDNLKAGRLKGAVNYD